MLRIDTCSGVSFGVIVWFLYDCYLVFTVNSGVCVGMLLGMVRVALLMWFVGLCGGFLVALVLCFGGLVVVVGLVGFVLVVLCCRLVYFVFDGCGLALRFPVGGLVLRVLRIARLLVALI